MNTTSPSLAPVLLQIISNWHKRRRLRRLQQLDDHILKDIGINRLDLVDVLNLSICVDPVSELKRRTLLRCNGAMSDATRRWLHDRGFTHPRIEAKP